MYVIHPFPSTVYLLIQFRIREGLKPIPECTVGERQGNTVNRMLVHHKAKTDKDRNTHIHTCE